jgi:hypothetical protein
MLPATGHRWLNQKRFFDVSNTVSRGLAPANNDAPDPRSAGSRPDARLESKAARMHMLGRMRGKHFFTAVMADSAMDVMLSLFVGELQSSKVSDTALAVGNLLSKDETDTVIERLVQAGLAVVTGQDLDRRTVGLTPLGSARMRSFVSDYPDV